MAKLDTYSRTGYVAQQIKRLAGVDDVVNLLDYGAAGDGVTDDTSAMVAALAASYGKTLVIPPGTYICQPFSILDTVSIVGVPGQSVLKVEASKPLGTVWISTPTSSAPTRAVTDLYIDGIVFDGASLTPQRWLQAGPGGATITDPEADYYDAISNPSGKIGNPGFPGYDITDAVADNRRNASYTSTAALISVDLIDGCIIRNCEFRNHYGVAIQERGGKDLVIEDCGFDTVGKNDGPYPAIFTQSFGTPGAGQPFYQDSENIVVQRCRARNLERSFAMFSPTKGGKLLDCYVDGYGESAIFCNSNTNYSGGEVVIRGNTIKNGIITDIVSTGIEANQVPNLVIENNVFEAAVSIAVAAQGGENVLIRGNVFKECCQDNTLPYGPFSERYAFNVGQPSIAGTEYLKQDLCVIGIGTQAGVGNKAVIISDNIVYETRSNPPYFIQLAKSGGNNLSENCRVFGNIINSTNTMTFIDASIADVFDSNISLWMQNNIGHASEAPVVVSGQFTVTGTETFDVGFRPSAVHVFAAANNALSGRMSFGMFTWNRAATRNDFAVTSSITTAPYTSQGISATDVIATFDSGGSARCRVEFVNWNPVGFTVNVISIAEPTNYRFVCYP